MTSSLIKEKTVDLVGLEVQATQLKLGSTVFAEGDLSASAGGTAGTVIASKTVVVDSNKDISSFRNLTAVNLKAGASGVVGTVDVFPATASKGKTEFTASDNTSNTTTTINTAAQATTRAYTIPDAGGTASFMMTAGAQTATGVQTLSAANIIQVANTGLTVLSTDASHTVGLVGSGDTTNRTLTIPTLGGNDTLATLALGNAFTGAITTTNGIAAGTARVIGGRVFNSISATDTVTAATSNNTFVSFANTYAIPASTLLSGSVMKMKALVAVSDAAAGTDTLTINFLLGSTSLIATTAVDPALNDFQTLDFTFTARAAPGATASCVGAGTWLTSTGGTNVTKNTALLPTNFATNGSLTLAVQAKWSSNSATTTARLEQFYVEII